MVLVVHNNQEIDKNLTDEDMIILLDEYLNVFCILNPVYAPWRRNNAPLLVVFLYKVYNTDNDSWIGSM